MEFKILNAEDITADQLKYIKMFFKTSRSNEAYVYHVLPEDADSIKVEIKRGEKVIKAIDAYEIKKYSEDFSIFEEFNGYVFFVISPDEVGRDVIKEKYLDYCKAGFPTVDFDGVWWLNTKVEDTIIKKDDETKEESE